MKIIFDWDEYRVKRNNLSRIEEKVIHEHFKIVCEGNDAYQEMSSPELEAHYETFIMGWIMSQMSIL